MCKNKSILNEGSMEKFLFKILLCRIKEKNAKVINILTLIILIQNIDLQIKYTDMKCEHCTDIKANI